MHYPPLHMWSHPDFINGKISVSDMTPEMRLRCDDGHTISSIEFASYGTPQGNCQNFSKGNCHSRNSLSVVSKVTFSIINMPNHVYLLSLHHYTRIKFFTTRYITTLTRWMKNIYQSKSVMNIKVLPWIWISNTAGIKLLFYFPICKIFWFMWLKFFLLGI